MAAVEVVKQLMKKSIKRKHMKKIKQFDTELFIANQFLMSFSFVFL